MAIEWDKMSDADFITEARRFLPVLVQFFERAEVHPEGLDTEPDHQKCVNCGGSGKTGVGLLIPCPICNPASKDFEI